MTDTEVLLLNVPLDIENNYTYAFSNTTHQFNFFNEHKKHTFYNLTYQRKDNLIRIPMQYDEIADCNYVMYKNNKYSNKWFYAFIKEMKYINDERTDIIIETDVIQTYLFDYEVGECFVEREHVDDDTIGEHTYPEQLEMGEYVCNGVSQDEKSKDYCYVLLVSEYYSGSKILSTNFGGIPSAGGAYICQSHNDLSQIVNAFDSNGKGDAVIGAYMIPKIFVENTSGTLQYSGQLDPVEYDHLILKPTDINGYKPKNNKLFTFPYNYLIASNNSGNHNIYQYEHFTNDEGEDENTIKFKIRGVPVIGGSIKLVPHNYKGIVSNHQESLIAGKFPTLSWSSDLYTNWLTQNAVNNGVGVGLGALSIVGGVALFALGQGVPALGMIGGGLMSITNTLKTIHTHSFTPDSAKGNVNAGDINTCDKTNTFFFYKMSIKEEYARVIDNYFTMYGYKVNRVKVPNKNHRSMFWFTKTIGCNVYIKGDFPISCDDLNKISSRYDKGITFWNPAVPFKQYHIADNVIQ